MADNNFRSSDGVSWNSRDGKAHGRAVRKTTTDMRIRSHVAAASGENPQYGVATNDGKRAVHKPTALTREHAMPAGSCRPTAKTADNARHDLRLRERFGRGGTEVSVRQARRLAGRKQMYSFFAGHAVDKRTSRHRWESDEDPSAGFTAWLLWGGDEGKSWVDQQRANLL
ncbi:hypothetical protein ACFB49_26940 [Sphingomonas sp. DBB INV C78]|uniref:DUF2945 domain-containing protein n=1 Tax=Sphingomonas sp. DBB INV C78 TaxID=3349434 RepID=UPI0036D361B4